MKSTSELTDFYYEELYPALSELEQTRRQIVFRVKLYGGAGAVLFAIAAIWMGRNIGLSHPLSAAFLIASVAAGAALYRFLTAEYTDDFKKRVITPLIGAIDPHLLYNPGFTISRHLFERSALFPSGIDRYSGNDYVKGTLDGVGLEFSDVHAEYQTRDSRGRTQWHTLFRGLFIVAEFNKHFKGRTVVLPDQAEKTFGTLIGGWLQSNNLARDGLIRLDDPEFEKRFVVYGNDPIEARYILTHAMMARILGFQKKLPHPLYLSFTHNHLHVAIETGKDLFEPSVFTSLLDYAQAMEYVATLRHTIGLAEELKLHEKLWSKS